MLQCKKILVVGDVMLDSYIYGDIERISPEAPIPILKYNNRENVAGGAANVACNIAGLGSFAYLISPTANDASKREIIESLNNFSSVKTFFLDTSDTTTTKIRYMSQNQQILRFDIDSSFIDDSFFELAKQEILNVIGNFDVVVLSDYAKGCLTHDFCQFIINEADIRKIPVIVDPKGNSFEKYSNAYIVKPNLKEFCSVVNQKIDIHNDLQKRLESLASPILQQLNISCIVITLGSHGAFVMQNGQSKGVIMPANKIDVADVSGAGDTFISTFAVCTANRLSCLDSIKYSNIASSLAVQKPRTAVITKNELYRECRLDKSKIVRFEQLKSIHDECYAAKKKIGFTNGCFDCCHLGHLHSLKRAKSLCDVLVVGVNSDSWIRQHKGKDRPVQDEKTRISILAEFECVDYIIVFNDETALPIVEELRPDVIAKQGYSIENWPEGRFVESYGGKVVFLDKVDGYSTTNLVQRMRQ